MAGVIVVVGILINNGFSDNFVIFLVLLKEFIVSLSSSLFESKNKIDNK